MRGPCRVYKRFGLKQIRLAAVCQPSKAWDWWAWEKEKGSGAIWGLTKNKLPALRLRLK